MKVIAIVPGAYQREEKLIVEMTPSELKKIHGEVVRPDIGMTVAVGTIYDRLSSLRDSQAKLQKVRQQLRAVADLLEPLEGVVGCDAPAEEKGDAEQSGQS